MKRSKSEEEEEEEIAVARRRALVVMQFRAKALRRPRNRPEVEASSHSSTMQTLVGGEVDGGEALLLVARPSFLNRFEELWEWPERVEVWRTSRQMLLRYTV